MGSEDVIEFLKKHKKEEFTTPEISERIEIGMSSIVKIMRRLLKDPYEKINKRELTQEEKKNRYGSTVNVKIFVYKIDK